MFPRARYTLRLPGGRTLALGERTLVMGIINATPDSFADGGAYPDPDHAVAAALRLEADGADIIDVGGESTRPGAAEVPADEEVRRVVPVLRRLVPRLRVPVSIDTCKAEVARRAVEHGAALINDVSGLSYDPDLAAVGAAASVPLVLMHMRGRSGDMYRHAAYDDVVREVVAELDTAIGRATAAGIAREQLVIDPGLGFAKRPAQTFAVLARLGALAELDRPILVGPSRKSFLQEALGACPPGTREWGTAAAVTGAVLLGAHIVRVHGVREMTHVVRVADRMRSAHEQPTSGTSKGAHGAPRRERRGAMGSPQADAGGSGQSPV